jgi:hypothetical protein
MLDLLTPKPFRGDVVAAGVTVLVIAAGLLELRVTGSLDPAIRFGLLGFLWAFVLTLALRSPNEPAGPRAYQSVLYVAALIFALLALAALAAVINGGGWLEGNGTQTWVLALMTLHAALLGRGRNSPVCTLLGAAGFAGVLAVGLWSVTDEQHLGAVRWLLLVVAIAYAINAVRLHTPKPGHALAFAEAAGVTVVGLAVTWTAMLLPLPDGGAFPVSGIDSGGPAPGLGWTLFLLTCGLGLVGYGGVQRERGPIWIGALLLLHFCILEIDGGLWAWPLLLFALAATLLVAGLRPTTPAPPEPGVDQPAPPPLRFPHA